MGRGSELGHDLTAKLQTFLKLQAGGGPLPFRQVQVPDLIQRDADIAQALGRGSELGHDLTAKLQTFLKLQAGGGPLPLFNSNRCQSFQNQRDIAECFLISGTRLQSRKLNVERIQHGFRATVLVEFDQEICHFNLPESWDIADFPASR